MKSCKLYTKSKKQHDRAIKDLAGLGVRLFMLAPCSKPPKEDFGIKFWSDNTSTNGAGGLSEATFTKRKDFIKEVKRLQAENSK